MTDLLSTSDQIGRGADSRPSLWWVRFALIEIIDDFDRSWRVTRGVVVPHFLIGRLQIKDKTWRVEQRRVLHRGREPSTQLTKVFRVPCQPDRDPFVIHLVPGNELGEADRREQAGSDSRGKRIAEACQDR